MEMNMAKIQRETGRTYRAGEEEEKRTGIPGDQ